jgi:hypothetical protein
LSTSGVPVGGPGTRQSPHSGGTRGVELSAGAWHDQSVLASNGPDFPKRGPRGDRPADPSSAFGRPPAGAGMGAPAGAPPARGRGPERAPGRGGRPGQGPGQGLAERGKWPSAKPTKTSGKSAKTSGKSAKSKVSTEPPVPMAPVRRFLSIAIAGFSLVLGFGLVIGSQATQTGFTLVVFGAQLLFVGAWTVALRPPSPWVVVTVGGLTAVASSIAVNIPVEASLAPLGYVLAGAFGAAIVGQLALRGGRAGVTESLGVSMVIVVGVCAFGALGVLARQPLGDQVLLAGLASVSVGLAVARLCDVVSAMPRIAPQVPRGSTGVIAGAMAGTAAAAIAGWQIEGITTFEAAIAGMVAVLVAVVVDLGTGYAEADRHLEGQIPFLWLARHMQGPLGAFAFAAPAFYIVGVILR